MSLRKMNISKLIRLGIIFFILICLITAVNVILRKSGHSLPIIQNIMLVILIVLLCLFGWLSVRKCNSSLILAFFSGLILSFGAQWSLPLFHKGKEIFQLLIVNSLIFAFVTVLGALLAIMMKRLLSRCDRVVKS